MAARFLRAASVNFAAAADELHRQERARLAAVVTPRPEAFRSMTAAALRVEIAGMWERLGHDIVTSPDAAELVTIKGDRKFISMCGNPADPMPTGSAALIRLRDRVVASAAERGFFVSVRGFTGQAQHYAETAPVQLIDSADLIRAMHRSRKGMSLPPSYKAMCRQCGDIVQHKLSSGEAQRCTNGHFVAPTIARLEIVKPRQQPEPGHNATPQYRPLSRREIRAHNAKYEARMMRKPRAH
jgi:Restriction endonuclease